MPSYCFECRSCNSEFSLIVRDYEAFDPADIGCVACEKFDTVLIAFSESEDLALISLSAKITDLEIRIKELEGTVFEFDS